MPVYDPFLWMPKSVLFGIWNHFRNLIHMHVAPSAIITFEEWYYCFVPAFKYFTLTWVGWPMCASILGGLKLAAMYIM